MTIIGDILLVLATSVVCIVIQCVVVAVQLPLLKRLDRKNQLKATVVRISCLLSVVMLIMFAANLIQISIWALLFLSLGEFGDFQEAFYHSAVNFTTLGYGDIVMSPQRKVLGALEAANGLLMFGLTTSLLFGLLNFLIQRKLKELSDRPT